MYCEELREPVKYLKETKEGETFMLDFFEKEILKAKEEAMKDAEAKIKEIEKARKAEKKARKEAEKQAKQAKFEGILETAKNLLKEGFSVDNVAKFTKLKLADVKALTL